MSHHRAENLRLVLSHFAATTTVGGLTQICNAPHRSLKVCWLLIFLAFTGLTAYNTYTVFVDYYDYPVLTYVSVKYERSLPFPAVTICNLNPVPCTNLVSSFLKNMTMYRELFNMSDCDKKVTTVPLIFKLVDSTEYPEFTARLKESLLATTRDLLMEKFTQSSNTMTDGSPLHNGSAQSGNETVTTVMAAEAQNESSTTTGAAGGPLPTQSTTIDNSTATTDATMSTSLQTTKSAVSDQQTANSTTLGNPTNADPLLQPTTIQQQSTASVSNNTATTQATPPISTEMTGSTIAGLSTASGSTLVTTAAHQPPSDQHQSDPIVTKVNELMQNLTNLSLPNLITVLLTLQEAMAPEDAPPEARTQFATTALKKLAMGVLRAFVNENDNKATASSSTINATQLPSTNQVKISYSPPGGRPGFGPADLTSASEDYLKSETFTLRLAELRRTAPMEYESLSKKFKEVILRCEFQGSTECLNSSWFMRTGDAEYGSCFTFNSAFNPHDSEAGKREVGVTGNRNGLTLEMLTSAQEYLPTSVANSEGLRIVIHDPSEKPNPGGAGVNIRPNTVTDIAMKLLKASRLESPYETNCSDSWDKTFYQPITPTFVEVTGGISVSSPRNGTMTSPVYTFGACQSMCEIMYILEQCNCMDPHNLQLFYHKPSKNQIIGDDERLCVFSDKDVTDYDCTVKARQDLQESEELCTDCQLPCEDNIYELLISTATWPAEGYIDVVAKKYMDSYNQVGAIGGSKLDTDDMKNVIKTEFVKLNVYFQTMNLETIEEQAKYDIWGFLSSVGGAVGLYLGMCGVSLIELVELVFVMAISLCGIVWVKVGDDDVKAKDPQPHQVAPASHLSQKEPGKDMMDKMFRLTESGRQLRERNVYPIRVPEVEQHEMQYPKPGSQLDPAYKF